MRPSYLLLAAGDCEPGWRKLVTRIGRESGLSVGFAGKRIAAFMSPHWRCLALGSEGCVIGTLFERNNVAREVSGLSEIEARSIVASGGEGLLRSFWGGYVAALQFRDGVRVLRDPSATSPCYFATCGGITAFASDAGLLAASGFVSPEVDWDEVGLDLLAGNVPRPGTWLRGVSELLAGFRLDLDSAASSQEPIWSPWDHAGHSSDACELAADRLAGIVADCVAAWASSRGRLLASVSGGLDSSIVAACLARARTDATCVTMYGGDPGSDERQYARALCGRLGLALLERPYRLDHVDLDESLGRHLPRSRDRSHALAYERAHVEAALDIGAAAFVTGNGGDSLFGYSQSAAPIADRWIAQGLGKGVFRTLVDTCRQTGCSLGDAAAGAWRIARRPPGYRLRLNGLFLDPGLVFEHGSFRPAHPWLEAPPGALPGKAAHIASLLRVQQSFEPSRGAVLPVVNPLMSQPILEFCLGVPSWEWRAGGRDRALARRAFAGHLPPLILERRVKGSPAFFAGEVLDSMRSQIRERLLDGELAGRGIADRRALELALAPGRPCSDDERVRILQLVAAEAWFRSWAGRLRARQSQGVEGPSQSPT